MGELSEAWIRAVVPPRTRCAVCGDPRCRPVQGHHVIDQQHLRKAFPFGARIECATRLEVDPWKPTREGVEFLVPAARLEGPGVTLERLLWDPRNGMPVGLRCHERHTLAVERIPRSKLPAKAFEFAYWTGLLWRLDRTYGPG